MNNSKKCRKFLSEGVFPLFAGATFVWFFIKIKNCIILKKGVKKTKQGKENVSRNLSEEIAIISLEELMLLSQTNTNAFYLKFMENFPNLYSALTQFRPQLSDSELKFCMYLKMGYSIKEIARYTNSTFKSVESRKYRLRRKFGNSSDASLLGTLNLTNNK